ncbi:beta-amyrin 28-monooxygenase [Ziziphus jujuba]|uniref:Beta-amyrin 28-monooxygenase n=1 Tax=Ziziphus jujuba TaxID=326968 RepID=A0A6P3ZX49_ZIZJJ|nr:beta-amyrin 28-monooxygenase [Ziziphus jujuba]
MDLFILSLPLFAIALYYLYCAWKPRNSNTNNEKLLSLPPGPKCWPIIGDNLNYIFGSQKGGQDKFFEQRTNSYSHKLFKTKLFDEDMLFFCTAEGNKFVFSNENKLVKSWFPKTFEKIFAAPNSSSVIRDEIKIFRKVVVQFLKPESLKNYVDIIDYETQKHLKTCWDGKKELTVFPLMISYTIGLGFRLFLSTEVDPKEKEILDHQFHDVSGGLFPVFPFDLPGTKLNVAIKTAKQITKVVEKMVKQRWKEILENKAAFEDAHDVLTHLLMEAKGMLFKNDYDIAKKLYGFVNGAYENPSALISSIMFYLADLPQVYDRVRQEQMEIANSKAPGEPLNWGDIKKMKYTWNVACEVMRLVPPTQGNFREVLTDFVYEGFHIPKGFKIHLNAFATHKNPKYFPDPEKFDPSRFEGDGPVPFSYIPFGGGPRMCPGKEYGRLNVLVFMHNIVKTYRWEKVIPDEKITANPLSAPSKGLPIRLYPIN